MWKSSSSFLEEAMENKKSGKSNKKIKSLIIFPYQSGSGRTLAHIVDLHHSNTLRILLEVDLLLLLLLLSLLLLLLLLLLDLELLLLVQLLHSWVLHRRLDVPDEVLNATAVRCWPGSRCCWCGLPTGLATATNQAPDGTNAI